MTTDVHIVNLGPDYVKVIQEGPGSKSTELLAPKESTNKLVYPGQSVTIIEDKEE